MAYFIDKQWPTGCIDNAVRTIRVLLFIYILYYFVDLFHLVDSLLSTSATSAAAAAAAPPTKTAILMLNMGGPKDVHEVEPFLRRLFLDSDIIKLPMQKLVLPPPPPPIPR